jgi:ribosome-associated translation inhibitor RaiA
MKQILTTLLLLPLLTFGQFNCPELITIEGSQYVIITPEQANMVNAMENEARRFRLMADTQRSVINHNGQQLIKLETALKLMAEDRQILRDSEQTCADLLANLDKSIDKLHRKLNRQIAFRNIAITIAAIEAAVLLIITN